MSENLTIPFGKAVRVGNYKVWRGSYTIGSGRDKATVECVHVSIPDGSWSVRIPATSTMFSLICNGYATVDEEKRDQFLGMLFANMLSVCTSGSEALHDAFFFLSEMMSFPYLLLPEDEMVKRMKETMDKAGIDAKAAEGHVGRMTDYRRQLYELIERKKLRLVEEYERQQSEQQEYRRTKEEEDLNRDDIADEAAEILNMKDPDKELI